MLRLIYSLILFFASFNLWAQVSISKLSDRHYLDYKIQTTILVSSEVLKENVKHQILPDALCNSKKPSNVTTVSAEQLSLDLTKDVLYLVNDTLYVIRDVIQNFRLRSYLDSVQPVKINFLNDFKYTSRKIARLHGVAAVTVWFLSEFVQIVSIPITAALGIPEVGVLIVASPLNFINMAITIKAINVSHQLSLKKAYGGFVKKRQAIKNRKKIERKYVSKNENTILHQLATSQDTAFYVSLNRNNLFTEIFSLFRLNQNKVYFRNIKRFVKKNNVCDTVLNILQNKHISKQMRSVYAIDYLHKNNQACFQKLVNKHYKSFHYQAVNTSELGLREDIKSWVYRMCEIKNLDQLGKVLRDIPPHIKVHNVLELFDSIILKYWAENMNAQGFSSFRKMVKGFKKSSYQLLKQSDQYFTQEHADIILFNSGLYYTSLN